MGGINTGLFDDQFGKPSIGKAIGLGKIVAGAVGGDPSLATSGTQDLLQGTKAGDVMSLGQKIAGAAAGAADGADKASSFVDGMNSKLDGMNQDWSKMGQNPLGGMGAMQRRFSLYGG